MFREEINSGKIDVSDGITQLFHECQFGVSENRCGKNRSGGVYVGEDFLVNFRCPKLDLKFIQE